MKNKSLLKRVVIYPRSEAQKKFWEREADKCVMSLSGYLLSIIEESLEDKSGELDAETESRIQAVELAQENKMLKQEVFRLNKLYTIQEKELVDLRNRVFLEPAFSGVRSFDKELLKLLQSKEKAFNQDDIVAGLGISYSNAEAIRSLTAQLEALVEYSLVQITGRGWKWVQ